MDQDSLAEILEDARGFIEQDVRAGFRTTEAELLDSIVLMYGRQQPEDRLRAVVLPLISEAMAAHQAEQRAWPAITDCDRLDAAFAELEAAGIISRQNYTCCGTCGVAEIHTEIDELTEQGATVRGYTFFHQQDTEAAVDGHGFCLNYGTPDDEDDDARVAIGHEVAEVIRRHGLTVEWDGAIERRIIVNLDWKRRGPPSGYVEH
jgi:hypothetical protein